MPYTYSCSILEVEAASGLLCSASACDWLVPSDMHVCLPFLQIEGGFVQGMGWLCLEEMIWGDKVRHQQASLIRPV